MVIDRTRHHLEGVGIGDRDHVRLLDPVEPGDRRAVEAHSVVEGALHLGGRDREPLQMAFEVRKPQEDVLDALVVDPFQDCPPRPDTDVARSLLCTGCVARALPALLVRGLAISFPSVVANAPEPRLIPGSGRCYRSRASRDLAYRRLVRHY